MFTGIVEKTAQVIEVIRKDGNIRMILDTGWPDVKEGESISVNGVCLTALNDNSEVAFDLSPETLLKTCFDSVKKGDWVNLERSMPVNGRFSGHYVTGHVDTCARLEYTKKMGSHTMMAFSGFGDENAARYLIPKGSISINGVSLTINVVERTLIEVMIVPHTLAHTNLSQLSIYDRVNIEFDYLARLIAHQLKFI